MIAYVCSIWRSIFYFLRLYDKGRGTHDPIMWFIPVTADVPGDDNITQSYIYTREINITNLMFVLPKLHKI